MNMIDKFIEWTRENGWKILPENDNIDLSTHPILKDFQFEKTPLFCEFCTRFSRVESADETKWFLCTRDYKTPENEGEFAWNEFQKISLENTFDDDDLAAIEEFWYDHLPIMISVGGGYKYWALRFTDGKVVSGFEPMFEETSVAANSFEDFLDKIVNSEIL